MLTALLLLAVPALAADYGTESTQPSTATPEAAAPSTTPAPSAAAAQPGMALSADQSMYMGNMLRSYYGLSASDIDAWHARGYSDLDIAMAANAAMKAGVTTAQILALRDQGKSWADIAQQYNMSTADLFALGPAAMSPEEMAFNRRMLMDTYGLTSSDIDNFMRQGYTVSDISLAASVAARANRPVADVLALRRQGMSWTQIAAQYNLPAGSLERPYAVVSPEVDTYFRNLLRTSYNLSDANYNRYRAQGWLPRDIAFAANVASRSNQSVDYVLQLRDQGLSWREIAGRLGISVAELTTPVPSARVAGLVQREAMGMEMGVADSGIPPSRWFDHAQWGEWNYYTRGRVMGPLEESEQSAAY